MLILPRSHLQGSRNPGGCVAAGSDWGSRVFRERRRWPPLTERSPVASVASSDICIGAHVTIRAVHACDGFAAEATRPAEPVFASAGALVETVEP